VERTFGWLNRERRLSKDYERLPATTEAFVRIAMVRLMARHLSRESITPLARVPAVQMSPKLLPAGRPVAGLLPARQPLPALPPARLDSDNRLVCC
jgi:hypothetical protein